MNRLFRSVMLLIAALGFAGCALAQDYDYTDHSEWIATQLPRCAAASSVGSCSVSLGFFIELNETRYCGIFVTGPAYCYRMLGDAVPGGRSLWSQLPVIGINRIELQGPSSTKALPAGPAITITAKVTAGGIPAPRRIVDIYFGTGDRNIGPNYLGYSTDENGEVSISYIPPLQRTTTAVISATCRGCVNGVDKVITVSSCDICERTVGNPIQPATGEKVENQSDYADAAPHPLNWSRHYRSLGSLGAGLGQGWSHPYAATALGDNANRAVRMGDGGAALFTRRGANGPWLADNGKDALAAILASADASGGSGSASAVITGWRYTRASDESVWLFTADGSQLQSITQRNGWAATLAYDNAGRLVRITNAFGRNLSLSYNAAGLLTSVTPPDGNTIHYVFDSVSRLVGVRNADGTSQSFLYEDARFPYGLTGITDETGQRYASFSYNARGQAEGTSLAGGVGANGVEYYSAGGTGASGTLSSLLPSQLDSGFFQLRAYVYDPLGNRQTLNYQGGDGNIRLLGRNDAFDGDPLASRTFVPGTTLPEIETDFLGVTKQTTWDASRRLPLSVTSAANRPEAQTTQTQWHPIFRLPVLVTEQGATAGAQPRTTAYTYDAVGNKLSETVSGPSAGAAPRTTAYTYTPLNLLETITDPKGNVTRFAYDAAGNRTSAQNPLGQQTRYTYDAAGRISQETAPNGLVTAYTYDTRGRLQSAITGGETTLYTYTPTGQLASATQPNGYRTSYSYDAAQRLTGATDNRGNRISYQLDGAGNRIREEVSDASGQIALLTSRTISQLNKVAAIAGASGQTTQLGYDANAQAISQTDPLNQTTRQTLDGLQRPTATTFADNSQAGQAWNQLNQLTQVTDPKGVATQYQRNIFGEVISESSPDTGAISYQRDSNGDVVASTDARGIATQITRDALGRPTQVVRTSPAGTGTAASQTTRYTWDAPQVGYLSQVEDNTGSTQYERDTFGRILSKTQTVNPTAGASAITSTTRYSYANGDLSSITYPSGLKVSYNRSPSGQITGISTQEPGGTTRSPKPTVAFASSISYTALNQPKAWVWNSGDSAARSFDADGRMTSNEFAAYTFDAASRITGISQSLWASRTVTSVVGTGTTTITEFYKTPLAWQASYDNRDRLTGFKRDGSDTRYAYDPNSNRLSAIEATTSDTDLDGLFDADDFTQTSSQSTSIDPASNKLLGFTQTLTKVRGTRTLATTNANVSYQLDAAGNLTSDGLRSFEYDPANRLSKLKILKDGEASSISYLHNSLGQRVFKGEPVAEQTLPNQAVLGEDFITYLKRQFGWLFTAAQSNASIGTAFTYADGQLPEWALLGEYDNGSASGKGRTEYLWLPTEDGGAVPVGMYRNGKFFAVHADHLGTPRLITNEANQPVWQWPYSAFGNNKPTGVLKATPNPRAAITNQPVLLRATNPAAVVDLRFPGQHADDEAGVFYNYQRNYQAGQGRYTQNDPIGLDGGLNRFAYVGGNPLSFSDPYGQAAAALFPAAALAVGAAGVMAMSTSEGRKAAEALVNKIVDACTPGDPDPCRGLRKQLEKHEQKLSDYLNDPLAQDNRGLLVNALLGNDGAQAARTYEGRIKELRRQIEGWKREIKKCEEKNGR